MVLVGQQSTDTYSWAASVVCEGAQPARSLDGQSAAIISNVIQLSGADEPSSRLFLITHY